MTMLAVSGQVAKVSASPCPTASLENMRQGVNTLKLSPLSDTRASAGSKPYRRRGGWELHAEGT